jgi:hypothetical protein
LTEVIFLRLSPHAAILSRVFELAGRGQQEALGTAKDIARLIGVSHTRIADLLVALRETESVGAAREDSHGVWHVTLAAAKSCEMALMLKGARLFKDRVHTDRDKVQVVISKPTEPSKFASALESTLEGAWGLSSTSDVLGEMAARASTRFSIMTPFMDDDGAGRVLALFRASRSSVRKELILRNGLPDSLRARADELRALDVRVFDFRIARANRPENETFHAKVIRIDHDECYVGSSNMTKWSFDYSLELGFLVSGDAGARVSRVVDAVLTVSNEISLL